MYAALIVEGDDLVEDILAEGGVFGVDGKLYGVALLAGDGGLDIKSKVLGHSMISGEGDIVVEGLAGYEILGRLQGEVAVDGVEGDGKFLVLDLGDGLALGLGFDRYEALVVDAHLKADAYREGVDQPGGGHHIDGILGIGVDALEKASLHIVHLIDTQLLDHIAQQRVGGDDEDLVVDDALRADEVADGAHTGQGIGVVDLNEHIGADTVGGLPHFHEEHSEDAADGNRNHEKVPLAQILREGAFDINKIGIFIVFHYGDVV